MTHVSVINGVKVTWDCICRHPEITDNTCPTHSGNCEECRHCRVEMAAKDFFAMAAKK